MKRALILVAACGDGVGSDETIDAVSGSRMKLEWIYYADGSRQPTGGTFYDTELHARCVPTSWADGAIRCVPIADPAAFTDPACTRAVGLALSGDTRPDYFIGFDLFLEDATPARLYRAGPNIGGPNALYQLASTGECFGPVSPPAVAYFDAIAAFDADDMVAFQEQQLSRPGDPLTLVLRETADGLRAPIGLTVNALGVPCTPQVRGDEMVCAPDSADADVFLDPSCIEPGVQVLEGFPPNLVRAFDVNGCPAEHEIGERTGTTMYRRTQAGCVRVPPDSSLVAYALGPRLATPVLERNLDGDDSGNRLSSVTLGSGSLRWRSAEMFDTATRADCRPQVFGEAFRCLPTSTAVVETLLAPGCGFEVRVAELRAPACNPTTFANSFGTEGQLRAIGDPASELFTLATGACARYAPAQGNVVHELGPPLPAETFTPGIPAGER